MTSFYTFTNCSLFRDSKNLELFVFYFTSVLVIPLFNVTLFMILEKFVGISGSALQLIKSYFSDRTQRVVIDGILSEFANLVCGVPQGSVLGPMKFCLYLLPLCAILKEHNIGYHIYADDTQLYISRLTVKNL